MKPTKEQLSFLYDVLYSEADKVLEKYNPCERNNSNCINNVNNKCCIINGEWCPHLINNKCSIKCLGCKLYLCDESTKKYPDAKQKLGVLYKLAGPYNFLICATPKEELLNGV